jgi:hypothetical protein
VNFIAVAGPHRALHNTVLPNSESRQTILGATALAGAAALRMRYTEYSNTVPLHTAYSAELEEKPVDRIVARLWWLSVGRRQMQKPNGLVSHFLLNLSCKSSAVVASMGKQSKWQRIVAVLCRAAHVRRSHQGPG